LSALWSDPNNWDQGTAPTSASDLVFPEGAREKTTTDDLPSIDRFSITFTGEGYTLSAPGLVNASMGLSAFNAAGTNIINCPIEVQSIVSAGPGSNLDLEGSVSFGFKGVVDGGGDTLINNISWGGDLIKNGTGTLTVAGQADTSGGFASAVILNAGVLALQGSASLGGEPLVLAGGTIEALNSPLTLRNSISLDGDVTFGGNQPLTFTGPATLSGNRTLRVLNTTTFGGYNVALPLGTVAESIGDNGKGFGLTKEGGGTLVLGGSNTYSGETVLDNGTLVVEENPVGGGDPLGTGPLDLRGGAIQANGQTQSIPNPVMLAGDVVLGGTSTLDFAGPIALTGNRTLTVSSTAHVLLDGTVAEDVGGRSLTKAGPGFLGLDQNNQYSGGSYLESGILSLGADGALGSGPLELDAGTLASAQPRVLANSLTLDGSVTLADISGGGGGTFTLSGPVTLAGDTTLKVSVPTTINGAIDEAQPGRNFTKAGRATLVLSGDNSYTGTTTVLAGTLEVNGLQPDSDVIVGSHGILDGTGEVGAITVNGGKVTANDSPGMLSASGTVAFSSGSAFFAALGGPTAGTGYEQVVVNGSIDLSNTALQVNLGFLAAPGDTFDLLHAAGGISGTFIGLPNNTQFARGGGEFQITYTSTDVILTLLTARTATTLSSSANPSVFGQAVITATVTAPAGAGTPQGVVVFMDGTNKLETDTLVNGQARLSLPLHGGTHALTAVYSPQYSWGFSKSAVLGQVVQKAATTTKLVISTLSPTFGQPLTFTVTVAAVAPGAGVLSGTVTLKDGTTTLATVALSNGQATFTTSSLARGTHSVRATYAGNGDFNLSLSVLVVFTVL
jgi:autotransporter-associated beta strand protein